MTTATAIAEKVQDGVLKAVETGQRLTLDAVGAAVSTVDGFLPERPAIPFATALATPKEALDTTFRFAERLLESQKTFLVELAAIASPTPTTAKKPPTA